MQDTQYKFRASFSVLSVWEAGDWQRAIKMYFKLDTFSTPAMEFGKKQHEAWALEINSEMRLPKVFGQVKLKSPQIEKKVVIGLEDWLDLVGVPDLVDLPVIYEFKTGKAGSEGYANSMQGRIYQLLYPEAKRVEIYHLDQYTNKVDVSYVLLTEKTKEEALDWVTSVASEMHSYFMENKLYEKFGT